MQKQRAKILGAGLLCETIKECGTFPRWDKAEQEENEEEQTTTGTDELAQSPKRTKGQAQEQIQERPQEKEEKPAASQGEFEAGPMPKRRVASFNLCRAVIEAEKNQA